jgi:aldehyde:ferredoxin oxidoreductase
MWPDVKQDAKDVTDYRFRRCTIHLDRGEFARERPCEIWKTFGRHRAFFKLLGNYRVTDATDPNAPLIMNLGAFSGTEVMTGLRVFFSAYSPLKVASNGMPLPMWSAASGDFGRKMLAAGLDEVIFVGRAPKPSYLLIRREGDQPVLSLEDAGDLLGKSTHEKILALADRHSGAHVAALGPSGEHWQTNFMQQLPAATNETRSAIANPALLDAGMGILGSKNIVAIVAHARISIVEAPARSAGCQ